MQIYDVSVRPGGYMGTDVPKKNVSAAEILVLRHIHGEDSVINIKPRKMAKGHSHAEFRAALAAKYGETLIATVFGPNKHNVQLPVRLEDAPAVAEAEAS